MSNQSVDQVVDTPEQNGQVTNDESTKVIEPTFDDLQKEIETLRGFQKKNREEMAKYREINRDLRDQVGTLKDTKDLEQGKALEEQGQYRALYQDTKKKLDDIKKEKENLFLELQGRELKSKFRNIANEKGCNDAELAFVLARSKYKSMIDFEDEKSLVVNERSLSDVVEKMRLDHQTLFKQPALNTKDRPAPSVSIGRKKLEDMTKEEKMNLLKSKASQNL